MRDSLLAAFAFGVIGTGLLAIPILLQHRLTPISKCLVGQEDSLRTLKQRFLWVIIIGTLVGILLNFIGVNPIKALIYAAVLNGIIAVQ